MDATEENNMKKFLAIVLALLMVANCAALAEGTQATESRLVVGNTTALSGSFFTDMWGNNTSDIDVRMLLHGYNLIEWHSETGAYGINRAVVSDMATVDDEDGYRTYTLSLYKDLYYSDGTPITAYDYAFAILLSMSPKVAAIGGQTVDSDHIVGSAAYISGRADVLTGVRVLADNMISISVKSTDRPFFYELALLSYNPYPISVIAPGCKVVDTGTGIAIHNIDENVKDAVFTAALLEQTILDPDTGYRSHPSVVSGPYTLVSFDWDTRTAEFEINPYFKGTAAGEVPSIQHLTLRTVSNETMLDELANGEVDLLNKAVSAEAIAQGLALADGEDINATEYARSGFSFFSFNCERTAVSSQAVRQAIAYCLDQDALVAAYVGEYGQAVYGYYGIGQWMYQLVNGDLDEEVAELTADATADVKAAFAALSLDQLPTYALDIEAAKALLVADGWTLNSQGEAFDEEKDDVRYKKIGKELVALDLTLIYPEGNAIADSLDDALISHLAQVGIKLTAEAKPTTELLDIYYRNVARECDIIYLASNFDTVFDPKDAFNPDDAFIGSTNRTAIADTRLYNLAAAMSQTEPGDVLTYTQKWIAFQKRWAEVLPAIPVYSNDYFDFYTSALENYNISANMSWAQAIVGAYLK